MGVDETNYYELFGFHCGEDHKYLTQNTTITLNGTNASIPAVYRQAIVRVDGVDIPKIGRTSFNTATLAFKESADRTEYHWVVEFTCGAHGPMAPLFPGGFVGLNMYSRRVNDTLALHEMIAAVKDLGLGWAMEDKFYTVPHSSNCTY